MKEEVWKDIEDYEGYYQISNLGRIKSLERTIEHAKCGIKKVKERIMSNTTMNNGYEEVILSKYGKKQIMLVHRLVASTFIINTENKSQVNHINGIKTDNRVENLEWVSATENTTHSYRIGLQKPKTNMRWKFGKDNPTSKSVVQYSLNMIFIKEYYAVSDAHRETKIPVSDIAKCARGIRKIASGYIWKYKN